MKCYHVMWITVILHHFAKMQFVSQSLGYTLKYGEKIGKRNIWNKFIINAENVIRMKYSRDISIAT